MKYNDDKNNSKTQGSWSDCETEGRSRQVNLRSEVFYRCFNTISNTVLNNLSWTMSSRKSSETSGFSEILHINRYAIELNFFRVIKR